MPITAGEELHFITVPQFLPDMEYPMEVLLNLTDIIHRVSGKPH